MPDEHSRYGASSMSRWSVCPGSVPLLEKYPTKTSLAASEGTLAHNWAERKLNARIAGEEVPACPDADMEEYTNDYVEYCMKLLEQNQGGYAVEGKFDLDHIEAEHGDVFGTNDFSCWTDLEILHIVDLKYGTHRVKAENNKQLMFYALGCMHQHKVDPLLIYLHIYQPRVKAKIPYSVHEISIGELINFEAELRKAIKRVDEQPEVRIPGGHCFFCNRAKCPEAQEKQMGRSPQPEDTITFNNVGK
jgi:hypothetical protein